MRRVHARVEDSQPDDTGAASRVRTPRLASRSRPGARRRLGVLEQHHEARDVRLRHLALPARVELARRAGATAAGTLGEALAWLGLRSGLGC